MKLNTAQCKEIFGSEDFKEFVSKLAEKTLTIGELYDAVSLLADSQDFSNIKFYDNLWSIVYALRLLLEQHNEMMNNVEKEES